MSSRPLIPFACAFHNTTPLPLLLRFTNVDTKTCRMMMIERSDGVSSVAVQPRRSWWRWLLTPDIEWIECAVKPDCTLKLHVDASSRMALTARIHLPLLHKLNASSPSRFVLHFKHDDDTGVYVYKVRLSGARYVDETTLSPTDDRTDLKELVMLVQLTSGNSLHDGVEMQSLGRHVLQSDSDVWDNFTVETRDDGDGETEG